MKKIYNEKKNLNEVDILKLTLASPDQQKQLTIVHLEQNQMAFSVRRYLDQPRTMNATVVNTKKSDIRGLFATSVE